MLAKKYRLPFRVKFGKALFFKSLLFNAKIKQNGILHNRYAVVISKKIDKRATVRNRIKRLMHKALSDFMDKTKSGFDQAKLGFDFVFIVKKEAVGKTRKDFYFVIEEMLKKEGFLE